MHAPAFAFGDDGSLVEQHLDQFFHVKRVALGTSDKQLAQRWLRVIDAAQQLIGQREAVFGRKRPEVHQAMPGHSFAPAGAQLEQTRAGCHQHPQRLSRRVHQQMLHEVERGVVGPVQVFEQQTRRAAICAL